ncbi:hypothetical protein BC629DRAFT_1586352 [Irpex lacteus]|nr:hypothetical protein BC629DRAFT_1586352 [Irpex lacteus]
MIADSYSAARPYYTAQESALAGERAVRSPPPLLPPEAQPRDKPEVLHEESSLVPHDPSSSPHALPLSSPEPIGPTIDTINHEWQLSGQHTSSTNNALNADGLQGPRDEPSLAVGLLRTGRAHHKGYIVGLATRACHDCQRLGGGSTSISGVTQQRWMALGATPAGRIVLHKVLSSSQMLSPWISVTGMGRSIDSRDVPLRSRRRVW